MVVIFFAPTDATGVWHDRRASPSKCTVHAPHNPMPQPYLVPVSPRLSRKTHKSGVSGSTLTGYEVLFTMMVIRGMERERT